MAHLHDAHLSVDWQQFACSAYSRPATGMKKRQNWMTNNPGTELTELTAKFAAFERGCLGATLNWCQATAILHGVVAMFHRRIGSIGNRVLKDLKN